MYFYILIGLIVLYIVFFAFIRLKFKFWATQPVFHFYNLKYWIKPCGIIYHNEFPINKYYDPLNITVKTMDKLTQLETSNFHTLIQKHYLRNKNVEYIPSSSKIDAYFKSHNSPCFFASYNKNNTILDFKNNTTIDRINYLSVLTSRPLDVYINNNYLKVNYVDYLCTHKKHRKEGIAPKVIYTYAIESKKRNPDINVYLFKRETDSTAIVPIITYQTYLFNIKNIKQNKVLPPYTISKITADNFNLIVDVLQYNIKQTFNLSILPNIANIKNLIENECLIVYAVNINNVIYDLYIFRNSEVSYEGIKALDCIGSLSVNNKKSNLDKDDEDLLVNGFYDVLSLINSEYKYLIVENISHNNYLIKNLKTKFNEIFVAPTSYYFYNFVVRPMLSGEAFILS